MPFYAPPHFFELYPEPSPPVPLHVPKSMPYVAWHSCLSRAPGADYSDWGNFSDIPNAMTLDTPMDAASAARLRRGYSASISYTDDNIGKIIDTASSLGLLDSAAVALIGDHGWSLGGKSFCRVASPAVAQCGAG